MNELFLKIINMSISASWLILAVLILRLVLKKAPKWVNVLLWGIVAVRLICPLSFESALSLIPSSETIPLDIEMAAKEVRDVVASMVSIPEFIELVSKKVDCATDLSILKKKRESIKAEYAKYYNNLMMNEKRLAVLDTGDKHYDRRVDSLNRVMDDLYEKIDDSQSRLDELDNEIAMAEKSTLTKQSIFEMLEGFSKYYDVMTPEDRKALLQAMISYIELYGEKRADGHFVKAIHFTFPVTYDGESAALFVRTNEQQVETVVLLSRETNPLTVEVRMEVETGEVKEHPTYKRIQEYVQEKYGFKVHTAYIAEVKRMVGLDMHKAPNAVEQRKHEYHPCPPEKVEAIKDALRHFGLIAE